MSGWQPLWPQFFEVMSKADQDTQFRPGVDDWDFPRQPIAGTVNGISTFQHKGPVGTVEIVFANAALLTILAGIGNFVGWELAGTLAVLYLLATMLTTGAPVIEWFTKLVGGH